MSASLVSCSELESHILVYLELNQKCNDVLEVAQHIYGTTDLFDSLEDCFCEVAQYFNMEVEAQ